MLLAIAVVSIATLGTASAEDLSPGPENGPEAACTEIKSALRALGDAEHDESFALDLVGGANSTAIVEARLSVLVDRTQDLRAALARVRQSAVARDPMAEQCVQMGFHALVISEKLSSDVETVLYGDDDSVAEAPAFRPGVPVASPPVPQP
jgi:hypothetical protein